MNKSESKYFNTAIRMDEALLYLLEKKDFQYITVKEICDKAKVNRSTFYLHYETVADLLSETIEYAFKRFEDKFKHFNTISSEKISSTPTDELILITPEYLIPYLEFVKENRPIFNIALTQPITIQANDIYNRYCIDIFYPIMKRFRLAEYEMNYILTFYRGGMIALIGEWLKEGCKEDIRVIADLLISCVLPKEKDRYH